MNTKKLIALLCTAVMLFSVVGMPAQVLAVQSENDYLIINDHFGNGDLCGWEIKENKTVTDPQYSLAAEAVAGEDGNYALKYMSAATAANSWQYNHISRKLDVPVKFAEGTDVVIQTRLKQAGSGRSFLKYNLVTDPASSSEWNYLWGTLVMNQSGNVSLMNGYRPNATTGFYSYPSGFGGTAAVGGNANVITDAINKWYTYKIVIHGTEDGDNKTADYIITDDAGTEIVRKENFSIDFPNNSSWTSSSSSSVASEQNMNWVEDVLKTIDFRLRQMETLWIDYVQVWQEGVEITGVEAVANMDSVKVKFSANVSYINDLTDYVELYNADGTQIVESAKSFDAATSTVTLTPAAPLTMGEYYTVKADSTAIEQNMKYTYGAQTELTIQAPACVAENLRISGELIPGTTLTAMYDIKPANAADNGSVVTWYSVSGGELTVLGSDAEYNVTDADADLTVTFSVVPKVLIDGEEKTGDETTCTEYAAPLSIPVAENLTYDKASAIIDMPLSAVYDYSDADGDLESGSEIIWYKGSAADSNDYTELARGKTVQITADMQGSWLKYTVLPKNAAGYRAEGVMEESTPIGPVSDALTSSNLFVNGGLEDGAIAPWYATSATGYKGVELTDEAAYNGSYSLRAYPRPTMNPGFGQDVTLKAGKTYILSAMIKSASATTHIGYEGAAAGAGTVDRPYRDAEFTDINPDQWVNVTLTLTANANGVYRCGFKSDKDLTADAYIDDAYIGELMIKDIVTNNIAPIAIPQTGEEYVEITKGRIINQLDTTNGLTGEKPVLTVASGEGVYINGNNLIVTNKAVAGDVMVKVACNPSTTIPGVAPFEKYVTVTLLPNSNTVPEVTDVKISGTVKTGETLALSYNYYQVEGKADASAYQWMYADSENGAYQNIEDATGTSFTVTSQYADKFIKCVVTPAADGGETGAPITSNYLVKNTKPVSAEATLSGQWYIGGKVTGAYVYSDINGDEENGSTYRWLIADTENGAYTDIAGQTSKELILTAAMQDKFIKFAVTPANDGEFGDEGDEVMSEPHLGPVKPQAKDVKITQNGSTYTASYTYYHPHNLKEKGTTFGWYSGDVLVASTISYNANFVGTKTLTFKVVPSCENAPGAGDSVSLTITITGVGSSSSTGAGGLSGAGGGGGGGGAVVPPSSNTGGGGGSGGAAAGFQSGVTSINNMDYVVPVEKTEEPASDIENHWGKAYIEEMVSRGVMTADGEGNHQPDEPVTRKDMITFLFKALKLEKTDYTGEFSDISAEDEFAGYLQTMVDNGTIAKDTAFRPGDTISRQEMCKILYISLENAGKLEAPAGMLIAGFEDYGSISGWAIDYVNAIYGNGIMVGVSDREFGPRGTVTKAQAATMLVRLLSHTEEVE